MQPPNIRTQAENISISQLEGWRLRVRRIHGRLYLTAYKNENGRQVERCLGSLEKLESQKKVHTLRIGSLLIIIAEVGEDEG